MSEFRFDPPLLLKGNIVVHNLDDAVRFMIGYREARRPELQTSVLYRLEGAAGESAERHAGYAFRGWAEAEGPHHQARRIKEASASNYRPQLGNSFHRRPSRFLRGADDVQLTVPAP